MAMDKCIVLGIDAPPSSATRQAMRVLSDLSETLTPRLRVLLLHVIPIPYVAPPALGMYVSHLQPAAGAPDARMQAEEALFKVRAHLVAQGLTFSQIEICIRTGTPADEIARLAKEVHADLIVVGSRGNSTRQRVRRFLAGSTSRRALQLAPCPVMIVNAPSFTGKQPSNLVSWYEEALTRYLHEHPGGLLVFTPHEVAQMFVPPNKKTPGRKERAAAILALDHLARDGVLCRHDVKGEMRYVND